MRSVILGQNNAEPGMNGRELATRTELRKTAVNMILKSQKSDPHKQRENKTKRILEGKETTVEKELSESFGNNYKIINDLVPINFS